MKKLILLTLMFLMITTVASAQWLRRGGSTIIRDRSTLSTDLEVGAYSIDGDSSAGLVFDPDNDGTNEITMEADGDLDINNGSLLVKVPNTESGVIIDTTTGATSGALILFTDGAGDEYGRVNIDGNTSNASFLWLDEDFTDYVKLIRTQTAAVIEVQRATSGGFIIQALIDGDSEKRFTILSNGKVGWGDGSAAQDTFLERLSANKLGTSGTTDFTVARDLTVDVDATVTGDIFSESLLYNKSGVRLRNVTTDATIKTGRVNVAHYTNAEQPLTAILATSTATEGLLNLGGGTSVENAASKITFYTAANNTTVTGTARMVINSAGSVMIGDTDLTAGPFQVSPPAEQIIGAGNTISANGCGTIKQISTDDGGAVTTGTTNTFTAPAAANEGCCMDVVNTGTVDAITLDNNALFFSAGAADVVLGVGDSVRVCSNAAAWYQIGATGNN